MTLTDAQKAALDKLPITFVDGEEIKTIDGVQWRTVEALHDKGFVQLIHFGMASENREHTIEAQRIEAP